MRLNCKNKIIQIIKSIKNIQNNKKCNQAILIVDQITAKLLNSVVQLFFTLGVKNITKISLIKKPQVESIGIYYLSPQSMKFIKQDFKKQPTYFSINILLCEEPAPEVMKQLATQSQIIQRLAFFGLLKLNTKYLDHNCGLICQQMNLLKQSIKNQLSSISKNIGAKIYQSLLCSFGDNLCLKVFYQNQNANYMTEILNQIKIKHKEHTQNIQNTSLTNNSIDRQQKTINLLLVDRKLDLVSPLIRNFYYLAIISQLFHVDYLSNQIKLKEKVIKLNFDDSIFKQYKDLYFGKAQVSIDANFKKFISENKAAQMQKDKVVDKGSLKHIIRQIPEYNKKVVSYQQNISIMTQILATIKQFNLTEIGQIQHLIITGINKQGEQVKDKKIYQRVIQYFAKIDNKTLDISTISVKIYLLLLLCTELGQSQKKSLIEKIKLFEQFTTLGEWLEKYHMKISTKPMKLKPIFNKQKIFLEMHESVVCGILNELIQKGTSKYTNLMIIGQQIKKNISKFQALTSVSMNEWAICMLGGISINEICHLQRLGLKYQNNNINFLSDQILTTWNYIQRLMQAFV